LNCAAYGFLEVLKSDRISGLGFVLRSFPDPQPKSPDSHPPFRGNDEKESVFRLECAKLIRIAAHRFFQRSSLEEAILLPRERFFLA